jgi:hypothetical protein
MITNRDIVRLSDSGWTVYLSNYEGYFVGIDTLGRAWFIDLDFIGPPTGPGSAICPGLDSISAWDGAKWTKYSSESGWTGFCIDPPSGFSMAELHGQIWISTIGDLRLFSGSSWRIIKPEEIGLTPRLFLVVQSFAGANEVWVTGCYVTTDTPHGSDIYWYDGSKWQNKSMPEDSVCSSQMQEDRQGNVWLGVDNTLWRFTRATKEWVNFAPAERVSTRITALAFNEAGEPWFMPRTCDSQRGCIASTLYHLQNDVWIPISLNPGIGFSSLLIDPANHVWVSAKDGVYQIVNESLI